MVGIIAVSIAGVVAVLTGIKLILRRPALVLDDHGLALHATTGPLGRVSWREVAGFGSFELMGQRFLVVVPHDVERRVAMLPPIRRQLVQLNGKTFGAHFYVSETSLGATIEDVYAEIGARAPQLVPR